MAKISIVVPVYNEEKAIIQTIQGIKKAIKNTGDNIEIVVVDDGSTDRTARALSRAKGIRVLRNEVNKGYGASLKRAIRASASDYIMIIDGDGTYPADQIPGLIRLSKKYDMVVGSRTGKVVRIPFFRKPAKWILKHFSQYLAKTKIPDLNSGLRIFKKEIGLRFMNFFPDGFSFTTTLTIACLTNDCSVKYVPINYYERKGKSTIHPIRDFVGFINLIFRLTVFFKPLNVFIPISVFLFVLGALKLIRDFVLLDAFGLGGAMAILGAIQIAFLGILAELIIKRTTI